ncbi:hypothetical protein ACI51W_03360 [Pseudomonas marginalis]|uniref:hypothetical protein n=1 Tax=Pseudomonas marginalis TaxID=298 RepID=UPI0038690866
MNKIIHEVPSKLALVIAFVIIQIFGMCLFAISESRFFPMTKAHIYQNIGYYTGFSKQEPAFSVKQMFNIDLVFAKYSILRNPSNFYRVVRHLSEIPESDDYKIRMISLSDSLLVKSSVMVNFMNGKDLDGKPLDIKSKSTTLEGDSDEK